MNVLPIIDRELRLTARSNRAYRARLGAGIAALFLSCYLIWMLDLGLIGVGAMPGMFILKSTSYMVLALSVLSGVARTCDSISSEKRNETLGLLFLTDLSATDIVLGKLVVAATSTLLMLAAVVPILSVPILLGGISAVELVRLPVALLSGLLLALTIGLLVSSMALQQRAAFSVASGILLCLGMLLPLLAFSLQRKGLLPEVVVLLRLASPASTLEMSFLSANGLSTNWFWVAILTQWTIIAGALGTTCYLLPRTWKKESPGAIAGRWKARIAQWCYGSRETRAERRRLLLNKNAILWLHSRNRLGTFAAPAFAVFIYGLLFWCIRHFAVPTEQAFALLFLGAAVNDLYVRISVASLSSARLADDRQSGALEMILSTPLKVRDLVAGQWMSIRRKLLPTYIAMLAFYWAVGFVYGFSFDTSPGVAAIVMLFILISIGDFAVSGYVGIWKAMRVTDPLHAPGATLLRVLVVPWFFWLLTLPLIHKFEWMRRWFSNWEPYSYISVALLFWGVSSAAALRKALARIFRDFRGAATDRYVFEQHYSFARWISARLSAIREFVAEAPAGCAKLSADDGERPN